MDIVIACRTAIRSHLITLTVAAVDCGAHVVTTLKSATVHIVMMCILTAEVSGKFEVSFETSSSRIEFSYRYKIIILVREEMVVLTK